MSLTGFYMGLLEAASLINAEVKGTDQPLQGVSTDTRKPLAGTLFVALRGAHFDGHDHVRAALEQGAAAVMIDRDMAGISPALIVKDTRLGLGQLATGWRQRFSFPVVAVTGSNGKTTVKEMLAAILAQQGEVLATRGNLNNDIGLPLTLLQLDAKHRNAVVEMGANHSGEIAYLTQLGQPDVAVITNAAAAHLEGFGSLDGVAQAKGEIFSGLKADGVAVINADDKYASLWYSLAEDYQVLSFGLIATADVRAMWEPEGNGSRLQLQTPAGEVTLHLPLPGQHNVMNALAASAAVLALGGSLEQIRAGLESLRAVPGRLQLKTGIHGSRILDDTYNANPASLQVALDVLNRFPGSHYLALGDMGELGSAEQDLHAAAGRAARDSGVDRLYTLGSLARAAATSFGEVAQSFSAQQAMIDTLQAELHEDVTLLVKGSRRMHMERVVAAVTVGEEG